MNWALVNKFHLEKKHLNKLEPLWSESGMFIFQAVIYGGGGWESGHDSCEAKVHWALAELLTWEAKSCSLEGFTR